MRREAQVLLWFLLVGLGDALHGSRWLNFACTEEGDISAVNPNPETFHKVFAYSKSGASCIAEMSEDHGHILISDCGANDYPVAVILSRKNQLSTGIVGGQGSATYFASCNVRVAYYKVTVISFNVTTHVDPSLTLDPAEEVRYEMKDLMMSLPGSNFKTFTIGYPITIKLTGPPGTSIKPTSCVARSGGSSNTSKALIKDGCVVAPNLIFNFTDDWVDFNSRNVTGFNPNLIIDEAGALQARGQEPTLQRPDLWTHMFAFRFFDSRQMSVSCDVTVCPAGSPECDLSCGTEEEEEFSLSSRHLAKRSVEAAQEPADSRVKRRMKWKPRPIVGGATVQAEVRVVPPMPDPREDILEIPFDSDSDVNDRVEQELDLGDGKVDSGIIGADSGLVGSDDDDEFELVSNTNEGSEDDMGAMLESDDNGDGDNDGEVEDAMQKMVDKAILNDFGFNTEEMNDDIDADDESLDGMFDQAYDKLMAGQ